MTVCQECGLNTDIFYDHAPGCSKHQALYQTDPNLNSDSKESTQWQAVVEVASERGSTLARSILKDSLLKGLGLDDLEELADIEELEEIFFDDKTMQVVDLCTWAGVMSSIQVLLEQDFIDVEAVRRYLHPDEDGTI